VLDSDVAELITFSTDRGYLDIRADRQLTFAPNGKEAIVTFVLDEGRLYTLRSVKASLVDGAGQPLPRRPEPSVLSTAQIAGLLEIKAGDVYSANKIRRSIDLLQNAYLRQGYVDARVTKAELRDENRPEVDLLILVREGERFRTGRVDLKGNELTRKEVILRELDTIQPDRPLDLSTKRVGERVVTEAESRLNDTRLFEPGSVRLTVQPENPQNPGYRDILVEVKETNTGSLSFGAGVSSDSGVIGRIGLTQRNFDLTDVPDSFGEFITGRAFRGAGQTFNIELAPGDEVQTYSIGLTEPYLFNTDYSAGGNVFYRTREFDEYTEDRWGGVFNIGRRFGERWAGALSARYNNIDIHDIDPTAPQDYFDVEGVSDLTGLGFKLTRTTLDSRFRPTRGARTEMSVERVGALGGDYDFFKVGAEHQVFLPIDEDFLGRRTVLSLKIAASYIPEGEDEAPVFERYFLGGRSFRGFAFRTISPKGFRRDGTLTDDPVGGTWAFSFGPEIEKPIWRDIIAVAAFIDSGTVTNEVGFDEYRLSAGFGLRLYVELLGPAPLAFDFGFPLIKKFGDQERVFSFSIDLPF
jgi:outer membrane protein insertion porin family